MCIFTIGSVTRYRKFMILGMVITLLVSGGCRGLFEKDKPQTQPQSTSADPPSEEQTTGGGDGALDGGVGGGPSTQQDRVETPSCEDPGPTAADAVKFIEEHEALLRSLKAADALAWYAEQMHSNAFTKDTYKAALAAVQEFEARQAPKVRTFDKVELTGDTERKMQLLLRDSTIPAPSDSAKNGRLATLRMELSNGFRGATFCEEGASGKACTLRAHEATMATSRDATKLLWLWTEWRRATVDLKNPFMEFMKLGNEGAKERGFKDIGHYWRSKYDMEPEAFADSVEQAYNRLRPLYVQLHCYTRAKLSEHYGATIVPPTGPIPAHVLGNMWAQRWNNLEWLLVPSVDDQPKDADSPLTAALKQKNVSGKGMVEYAERFFQSIGFGPLPKSFWEKSVFEQREGASIGCHPLAFWPYKGDDVRLMMCATPTERNFQTAHHEVGHLYQFLAYKDHSILYANVPNDGFHEAIGDTISLSMTRPYFEEVGLLGEAEKQVDGSDINHLLRRALNDVAFLPFGILVDRWRWDAFSGDVNAAKLNDHWWSLRKTYQGVKPPVDRTSKDFDAVSKYHVPSNVPYTRYFMARIFMFQFHRALCKEAGHTGPLHTCSIYGSTEAGAKLRAMMELGASKSWPEALEVLTGSRDMDTSAMVDYYAPLMKWLEEQNTGRACGW